MLNPVILVWYRWAFFTLAQHASLSEAVLETKAEELLAMHLEPHRAYHNWNHITSKISCTMRLSDHRGLSQFQLAENIIADFYHDCIYNTHNHDNEEASINKMLADMDYILGDNEEFIASKQTCKELVLLTKHTDKFVAFSQGQIMIDSDLAILQAPEKEYDKYAQGIRQEYSWVSPEDYQKGRLAILEGFLNREQLFYTSDILSDKIAKSNIQREINELRAD